MGWFVYALLIGYLLLTSGASTATEFTGVVAGAVVLGFVVVYVLDNALDWLVAGLRRGYRRIV
jgi:hypothetical protein